ncbi:hypothetical protein EXIGLDRAFT_783497 [Exidia glandulosa HHB12029]|uniref:Uncharacterized protein n=1 Tax=Exidia glandulosa HHB12029 TaxID=1314781 RepID=A0A166N146_EXIGL|nr:hypothetical protein EXIGLDRAFT_783497 [Exidia glandulosa HHB12029]
MAKRSKTTTKAVPPTMDVDYVEDSALAESGYDQLGKWTAEVVEPFREALDKSSAALAEWLRTACANAVAGSVDAPGRPPSPCVVNGDVVASAFAPLSFFPPSKVASFFASEFGEPENGPEELKVERLHRLFSCHVLAQVFLAYRITDMQIMYGNDDEEVPLFNSWFFMAARAVCWLVRPGDFALLPNLSFAVVCCIVDAGFHHQRVWPASLMTAERVDAAQRGLRRMGKHERSITFADWAAMSCLPLARPCNRCAASQVTKKGRPRICTFQPRGDGSVVSCLACVKNGKSSECQLLFVKDASPKAEDGESEPSDKEEEEEEEEEEAVVASTSGTAKPAAGALPNKELFAGMHEFLAQNKRKASAEEEPSTPKKHKIMEVVLTPLRKVDDKTSSASRSPVKATVKTSDKARPARQALAPLDRSAPRHASRRSTAGSSEMDTPRLTLDEGAAAWLSSALSRAKANTPPLSPPQPVEAKSQEAREVLPDRPAAASLSGHSLQAPKEPIFMPGDAHRTAAFALKAATSSDATITVPLVDYEALVTFYESLVNLEGMTGVDRAARRGRDAVDAARRKLGEHDDVLRSIAAGESELKKLNEQIAAHRRELEGGEETAKVTPKTKRR